MKKIISTLLAAILLLASVICFSGCSCIEDYIGSLIKKSCEDVESVPEMEQGDFVYYYVSFLIQTSMSYSICYKENAKYIAIAGLTEEGKKKETIVIPEEIEDMPVVAIGRKAGLFSYDSLSGKYNKLYLPTTIQLVIKDNDLDEKNFLINLPNEEFFKNILNYFYVPESKYEEFCAYAQSLNEEYAEYNWLLMANLTYIVDGNVYWIDDYNEGEKIVFPEEPKKEGFTFEGWYKEPELINKWNVEEDVYTKDESLNTVNLYAKFEVI